MDYNSNTEKTPLTLTGLSTNQNGEKKIDETPTADSEIIQSSQFDQDVIEKPIVTENGNGENVPILQKELDVAPLDLSKSSKKVNKEIEKKSSQAHNGKKPNKRKTNKTAVAQKRKNNGINSKGKSLFPQISLTNGKRSLPSTNSTKSTISSNGCSSSSYKNKRKKNNPMRIAPDSENEDDMVGTSQEPKFVQSTKYFAPNPLFATPVLQPLSGQDNLPVNLIAQLSNSPPQSQMQISIKDQQQIMIMRYMKSIASSNVAQSSGTGDDSNNKLNRLPTGPVSKDKDEETNPEEQKPTNGAKDGNFTIGQPPKKKKKPTRPPKNPLPVDPTITFGFDDRNYLTIREFMVWSKDEIMEHYSEYNADIYLGIRRLLNANKALVNPVNVKQTVRHKPYICKPCQKNFLDTQFTDKLEFWSHLMYKHMERNKIIYCPFCPFVSNLKHHMDFHLKNHYGFKGYHCPECLYVCNNAGMLNSHLSSHNIKCDACIAANIECPHFVRYIIISQKIIRKVFYDPDEVKKTRTITITETEMENTDTETNMEQVTVEQTETLSSSSNQLSQMITLMERTSQLCAQQNLCGPLTSTTVETITQEEKIVKSPTDSEPAVVNETQVIVKDETIDSNTRQSSENDTAVTSTSTTEMTAELENKDEEDLSCDNTTNENIDPIC